MIIKEVAVLEEVSEDIEEGISFYEEQESWVGEYFFDSIVSDIESLRFYAGMHSKHFGYYPNVGKKIPFCYLL